MHCAVCGRPLEIKEGIEIIPLFDRFGRHTICRDVTTCSEVQAHLTEQQELAISEMMADFARLNINNQEEYDKCNNIDEVW